MYHLVIKLAKCNIIVPRTIYEIVVYPYPQREFVILTRKRRLSDTKIASNSLLCANVCCDLTGISTYTNYTLKFTLDHCPSHANNTLCHKSMYDHLLSSQSWVVLELFPILFVFFDVVQTYMNPEHKKLYRNEN